MFNWIKSRKKSLLSNWNIENIPGFERIQNSDSVQYVNSDASRAIYFSTLKVSGSGQLLDNYNDKFTIVDEDGGWKLKGTKKYKNYILVCVISVKQKGDIEWAKEYFEQIIVVN